MILYRYETWRGEQVAKDRVILPTKAINDPFWPKLVFLTINPEWNRAAGKLSSETPCWRFRTELREPIYKMMYPHPHWLAMFSDARLRGSDLNEWQWTTKACPVLAADIWFNGEWIKQSP